MKIFYLTFFVTIIYAQNPNSIMQATAALNAGMYEALSQPKEALEAWKNCLKYSREKKVKKQAKNHIKILSYEL